jgi:hypothetical protein
MKKLSDENFTYPAGTSVVSKQSGASDLPEPYAAQRDQGCRQINQIRLGPKSDLN